MIPQSYDFIFILALQQAGAYEITAAAVAATEELPKSLQKSTEKRK